MGIEMNYTNQDNHVPEAETNSKVKKERFIISYYQLPYKNILRIMIRHLVMNVTRNLNMFPAKGGVLDHYTPLMILSQRN